MEGVNVELIAVIVGGVVVAGIMALAIYLTTKNPLAALLKLAEELGKQKAMLDAVEAQYMELPESTRKVIDAALAKAVEIAAATDTPLDDAFVDVFRKMTDGLPNVRAA